LKYEGITKLILKEIEVWKNNLDILQKFYHVERFNMHFIHFHIAFKDTQTLILMKNRRDSNLQSSLKEIYFFRRYIIDKEDFYKFLELLGGLHFMTVYGFYLKYHLKRKLKNIDFKLMGSR